MIPGPSRRAVMVGLGGAAAAAVFVGAAPSPATIPPDTLTVWRLATEWSEPRGPHGKTRLRSRASRTAAMNRFAPTEAAALDLNLHLCSWAPAEPVVVCRSAWEATWARHARTWANPWNGRTVELVDRRQVEAADGPGAWDAVVSSCSSTADAVSPATLPTVDTTTPTTPAGSAGAEAEAAGAEAGAAGAEAGSAPGRSAALALTGADLHRTAVLGAALAVAGAALLDRRRRVTLEADAGGAIDG